VNKTAAVPAPLAPAAEDAGKRTATEAGLPEAASKNAAPAAKQLKENATPVIPPVVPASKPKEVIEVEAPRANAA
jgi:hypothetical protein